MSWFPRVPTEPACKSGSLSPGPSFSRRDVPSSPMNSVMEGPPSPQLVCLPAVLTRARLPSTWRPLQLLELGDKFFVKEREFKAFSSWLYSSILQDLISVRQPDLEDLARLVALKTTLELAPPEVAACHERVSFAARDMAL